MKLAQFLAQTKVDGVQNVSFDIGWQVDYVYRAFYAFLGALVSVVFIKPKTVNEALVRMFSSIAFSALAAPFLFELLPSAWVTSRTEGPLYAICGIPAWWILGWLYNFLEKRRQHGIDEVYDELRGRREDKENK